MIVRERSATWLGYLLKARRGSVLSEIKWRLGFFVLNAVLVTACSTLFFRVGLKMTLAPFTIVGVALSIFLAFRNNAAYDRFWEARKLWGALVNETRSLTRQTLTLLQAEPPFFAERRWLQEQIVHLTISYCHALRIHLRDGSWDELHIDDDVKRALESEHNRPNAILSELGALVAQARARHFVSEYAHMMLEQRVVELTGIQGGCERIKSTPIPLSHTALTHRITALYLLTLPLGLYDSVGMLTPLVVFVVGFAFLGLDTIGDEMEDPFGFDLNDLPLEALCRTIEINLRQRLGETELPELPEPDAHGILR